MNNTAMLEQFREKLGLLPDRSKVLILGLGISGFSTAKYLIDNGFEPVVADTREKPPLYTEFKEKYSDIKVFTGRLSNALFEEVTHLMVSPGLALTAGPVREALANGVRLFSDIDLFACAVDQPIVAITGSNGKSTVTTLLGEMAEASGVKASVGGNLGRPALQLISDQAELYILELSSFQLERTSVLQAAAATVLNISPDHMDRYDNIAEYTRQKQRIFNGDGVMVLNADDARVLAMSVEGRKTVTFSLDNPADYQLTNQQGTDFISLNKHPLIPVNELSLQGRHNVANAMAAMALGSSIGLSQAAMCRVLKSFSGLEHRMQRVAEINDVIWINDSKATNVGACLAALLGFKEKVVLIAGGDAKGADMSEFAEIVKQRVKAIILMGKDAPAIERLLSGFLPVHRADDMEQAVNLAARLTAPGDYVLLSPACASLDQFKNFQERGNRFTEAVRRLAA